MYEKTLSLLIGIILSALALFSGCNVNDSEEFRDTFSYQISEQSVIETDTMQRPAGPDSTVTELSFNVVPGNNTVFRYEHSVIPPDDVLDGGLFETLLFQIPSGADKFSFSDEELAQASTIYFRSSAFRFIGDFVTSGQIRGERLSPVHWIIRADVTIESIDGTSQVEFEEPFYVE